MLLFSHNQPEGLLKGIVLLPTHNQPERNVIFLPQPAWRPAQRHCGIYCPPSTSPNGLLLFTHNQPEGLLKERHCVIAIHDQPEQTVIAHPQPARTDLLSTHNQPEDQLKCTVLLPTYDQPKWTYCPPTTSPDRLIAHPQPAWRPAQRHCVIAHPQPAWRPAQMHCVITTHDDHKGYIIIHPHPARRHCLLSDDQSECCSIISYFFLSVCPDIV